MTSSGSPQEVLQQSVQLLHYNMHATASVSLLPVECQPALFRGPPSCQDDPTGGQLADWLDGGREELPRGGLEGGWAVGR